MRKTMLLGIVALGLSVPSLGVLAQSTMVAGEVVKVDQSAGKITIKHGPIKKLDMKDEGMTMVFKANDPGGNRNLRFEMDEAKTPKQISLFLLGEFPVLNRPTTTRELPRTRQQAIYELTANELGRLHQKVR